MSWAELEDAPGDVVGRNLAAIERAVSRREQLRRPLGPDNLVTLTEICVELRVGKPAARELVDGLASCQRGKARLYRWRDVVAAAFDEPAAASGGDAPPAPRYAGPRAKL
ncbi:MAG: hypothetical protein JNM72_12260 [Deltaproteobacteria bacterium]|nr:hypothetical protein [Deltaproteobacteria bacterium]